MGSGPGATTRRRFGVLARQVQRRKLWRANIGRAATLLAAVGVVLGLVHLTLRPGLPLLAAPAAQCSAGEAPAEQAFESEPIESLIDGGVR